VRGAARGGVDHVPTRPKGCPYRDYSKIAERS
jgi:hypothetical protein